MDTLFLRVGFVVERRLCTWSPGRLSHGIMEKPLNILSRVSNASIEAYEWISTTFFFVFKCFKKKFMNLLFSYNVICFLMFGVFVPICALMHLLWFIHWCFIFFVCVVIIDFCLQINLWWRKILWDLSQMCIWLEMLWDLWEGGYKL